MPDDLPPGGSPQGAPNAAPPDATGGGGPSAGATPLAGPGASGTGATPPLGGPAGQAVQPAGLIAQNQVKGSVVMRLLNEMLQAYHPSDEQWKDIAGSLQKLSKHFPAMGQGSPIPTPKMATGNAASSLPMPPMAQGGAMSGGPLAAMAQRGPLPGAPQG